LKVVSVFELHEIIHFQCSTTDSKLLMKITHMERGRACSTHGETKKGVLHNILVRKHGWNRSLRNLALYGRKILRWILERQGDKLWTELIWLRTGTSSVFWTWCSIKGGVSWLTKQLSASLEGLCSMELNRLIFG